MQKKGCLLDANLKEKVENCWSIFGDFNLGFKASCCRRQEEMILAAGIWSTNWECWAENNDGTNERMYIGASGFKNCYLCHASTLDSIEAGAAVVGEDSSTGNAKNFLQKKESPTDQNDKTDNAMGTNGQLIQARESIGENKLRNLPP
ncbi:Uncharacterized protein Fot_19640 [Forsythia ovata]|uniref:Uncharacterized protein n=1 Tax=Forsythia ovata TaxID=205694 RepID=A0ABD1VLM4_9LAMI